MKRQCKYFDFTKLVKVAVSCKTPEHCESGFQFISNYAKYHDINEKTAPWVFQACGDLTLYLLDTAAHIRDGHHSPAYLGYTEQVNTYPDINNYIQLGIRLKNY